MKKLYALALLLVVASARSAPADRQLVDRVVAVVEDEAIFASDIEVLVRQAMVQQGSKNLSAAEQQELAGKVLEDLINDKLVIAEAGRLNITIPFEDVEKQVNKAIDENRELLGGEEAFERQLEQEGFTMESLKKLYREQVHNRMLVERVLQVEMQRDRGAADDVKLEQFYEEHKAGIPIRPAVAHLRTIFIGFGTSPKATEAARQKIDAVFQRVLAGESFADLAREHSEDPSGRAGGDLGFINPGDLSDPVFAATAQSLDVGDVSEPVLTSYGYHLIQVTEKRPESGELRVSHILVRVTPADEDIAVVFESAQAIRDTLAAGASFEAMADRYNTDPAAGAGGDLGWLKVAELPEFFRDVLSGLSPGDISQVMRESAGFRIVQLVEREVERPYEFAEITGELRRLYQQESMATMYADYIDRLRKKFSVDIKD
jgi:peptidyl-prolyl cis-trans isomerase SurA